jgi:uncharacterized protein (DUF433 family)
MQYNQYMIVLEPTTIVPLRHDLGGAIRVGQTRVTLETVIYAWQQGNSAEEILEQYSALNLADIHAVLAWALRNPEAIKTYMQNCAEHEAQTKRLLEADPKVQAFNVLLRERIKAKGLGSNSQLMKT